MAGSPSHSVKPKNYPRPTRPNHLICSLPLSLPSASRGLFASLLLLLSPQLPRDLCFYCSRCLEYPPPGYLHESQCHFLQIAVGETPAPATPAKAVPVRTHTHVNIQNIYWFLSHLLSYNIYFSIQVEINRSGHFFNRQTRRHNVHETWRQTTWAGMPPALV